MDIVKLFKSIRIGILIVGIISITPFIAMELVKLMVNNLNITLGIGLTILCAIITWMAYRSL